ncbi:MAG: hypothetical protein H6766_01420 [Candidatus Peribacteria bacterium]|nr:MAG: hypothetical protein H6766_01420 [Candidatus Peribacteria bacterium]
MGWIGYTFNLSAHLPSIRVQLPRSNSGTRLSAPTKKSTSKPTIKRFGDESETTSSSVGSTTDKELVKKMLMSKVKDKIDQTEKKKSLTRYNFPSDKPTYVPSQVLAVDKAQSATVSETFLLSKVKDLQSKLAEFNVPVEIE